MDKLSADESIRAALARDDPAAVELIWGRYARDLFAFLQASLCSKHDAEDVLQAVFVRIACKRRHLAKARSLDAYVYTIARREMVGLLRQRRRKPTSHASLDAWLEAAEARGDKTDLVDEMQTVLAQLPQAQREIVVMKVYRDKTFREIAESLKLSLNTVASRYRYGIEKLKALLKDPGS
ncbi:MAG: RNA polymerase sigma factor [Phycisphaerales bacterium]